MKGRLLFILTLWASLGVALLSALAPIGPPSSRLTGSAFNPATLSVVLKGRAHADPVVIRTVDPDGDGRAPFSALAVMCLLWIAALSLRVLPLPAKLFTGAPLRRPAERSSPRQARAPPLLC
ncbi:hypothetical protein [Sphingobium bisphenolivorans]|uniref:hypothetical protein n=1 Tax=Sphingobium bisphenolivorans TaxID=1335760 RepID=UPI00039D5252|nr:hypothetical protein [Sphingobium bisphenolivorans]